MPSIECPTIMTEVIVNVKNVIVNVIGSLLNVHVSIIAGG